MFGVTVSTIGRVKRRESWVIDDLIRTSEICYEKLRRVMNEDKNEK